MPFEGLWTGGAFILAFGVGFLTCKALDRRKIRDLQAELEELQVRLQGADNLLAKRAIQSWQDVRIFDQESQQGAKGGSATARNALEKTETSDAEQPTEDERNGGMPGQRVRVTKVIGKEEGPEPQTPIFGIEKSPPVAGESYRIVKDDGSMFYTSMVTKVSAGYIQTVNSVYKIESLESAGDGGSTE